MLVPSMGLCCTPLTTVGSGMPAFQNRRRNVDDVAELTTDLALGLDTFRPMHDRAVARAAPVRSHLFGPLIRRVHGVRPTDGIMVEGIGTAQLIHPRRQEIWRLHAGHTLQP